MDFLPIVLNLLRSTRAIGSGALQEPPIRAELLSLERLEQHAEALAGTQTLAVQQKPRSINARVRDNERILAECYVAIASTARQQRAATPAAEWLLDNFYVVEEQIRALRDSLTAQFYRKLPPLANGPLNGYPRVFALAWSFVEHTDSRFDPVLLHGYLTAYQKVAPLTIAELWAVSTSLQHVLIENLRRLSLQVVCAQTARHDADEFADEVLASNTPNPELKLPTHALSPAFMVQLIQRLRYQDLSLQWLNELLATQGLGCDVVVQSEHASQAAANMTVRNIITSMRAMAVFDWQAFFESVSLVDRCLSDAAGFRAMDFVTRDRYRHAIEDLARGSQRPELEIACTVIANTQAYRSAAEALDDRRADPGYYLISTGRAAFEQQIGFRVSLRQRVLRAYVANASFAYLGTITLLTAIILAMPLLVSAHAGAPVASLWLLGLLALIPASDIAIALMNKVVTETMGPRHLPRLQLPGDIPEALRTFVVVPVLLTDQTQIAEQIEQLAVHYLANPHGVVHYALLSDWLDAPDETLPQDAELLAAAAQGVAALNTRYGPISTGEQRFFLFHRKRLWNKTQGQWLGWERKRGKLHEFNRLLRGATDTSFIAVADHPVVPPAGVVYVITLDSDTRLPMGSVRQLVGTAAHPLNRPRFDPALQRVVEGYGILQPRITPTLPSARESSVFQYIYSGPSGIDPYAGATSDVYQDLFGEGSFTGKGLYDVDAFTTALAGRIPENAVLSHDLFEGIFARCGLVSDIELFEDFPSHSEVAASCTHRWARGDWQLLPWILGRRGAGIPAIGRWRLIDNLRRSLSAPMALFTLLASWSEPLIFHRVWTVFIVLSLAFPALLTLLHGVVPHRAGVSKRHHLRVVADDLLSSSGYAAVAVTLLAHHAGLMLDAIIRTLYRLTISRRRLLEWRTAAHARNLSNLSFPSFVWALRSASVVGIGASAVVLYFNRGGVAAAAPFLVLWWSSPVFAWLISQPPKIKGGEPLSDEERLALRWHGRRIWRFFATFVGSEDHGLPPDNFQEDPRPEIAHRSSPTNFGLYLLATVAARDFGWIGHHSMVQRLHAAMQTLQSLGRYRGHFYNWYDTRSLRPLDPQYISSVDSGNLAGHLLALASACGEMIERPVFSAADLAGIKDTLGLCRAAVAAVLDDRRTLTVHAEQLGDAVTELEIVLRASPITPSEWAALWRDLRVRATTLLDIAQTFAQERGDMAHSEILAWAQALHSDVLSHEQDLSLLPLATSGVTSEDEAADSIVASNLSIAATVDYCERMIASLDKHPDMIAEQRRRRDKLIAELRLTARACQTLCATLTAIADQSRALFQAMDFRFLYDPTRRLFAIGYQVADATLDASYYDLLASEARLTSFIAIAKGDIPVAHWFCLGRTLTKVTKGMALVSWSGSMFEYLMPSLVMYTPRHSLLDQTCRVVVKRQIEYGNERHVPWGVSESAYNVRDRNFIYQYSGFGVPDLGLKRGLAHDLVIAPYATALGAMYAPHEAAQNFARIEAIGGRGDFGFYEAIDFTPARLPETRQAAVVHAYMAHHQGMSLVALANVLHHGVMRHRFHREPVIKAAELLLQERPPRTVIVAGPRAEQTQIEQVQEPVAPALRRFGSPHQSIPATHLLANGQYAVMLTAAGSGYSVFSDIAITRWREDATCDCWGSYLFLRDTGSGQVWSAGYQPTGVEPDSYEALFLEDRARITRSDGALSTSLEVIVSAEDSAEIRRLSITNAGLHERQIEVTSYAEIVLAPLAADIAHPAFSNLFVQTEYVSEVRGLIAARRPRTATAPRVWAAHVIAAGADAVGAIEYETDRMRFLGRGHSIRNPLAVQDGRPLSNTVGPVLDPIFSLRARVRVEAGATVHLVFVTLTAPSREAVIALADKYHDPATFERASTVAWSQAQVHLHHIGVSAAEAHLFQSLANRILYWDPLMRPNADVFKRNTLNAKALWRHCISGDRPIVLLHIDDIEEREIVRQLLRAHEYWRNKRLSVDLVIVNEKKTSYAQELQGMLENLVRASQTLPAQEAAQGGIFVLRADLLSTEEAELLRCAAHVTLTAKQGNLAEQVLRMGRGSSRAAPLPRPSSGRGGEDGVPMPTGLEFFNGLGGFGAEGREYVTVLGPRQRTPAPWLNIIANPGFGFQVSESGAGYTWAMNSRENQLTPWSNDPVSDPVGEVIYIRDNESGELWSATAAPIRIESVRYSATHGQGYSKFQHVAHGIAVDLQQFVAWDDPIKLSTLSLENRSGRSRRLSLTAYVEWVLGATRAANAPFVITEIDPASGALFAMNPWSAEFGTRVAFASWIGNANAWTADRREFIGRNGDLCRPAALAAGAVLSNRVGTGMDPCCALQTTVTLAPGQRLQLTFLLGQSADRAAASALVERYRRTEPQAVLAEVTAQWQHLLGTVQVTTPDRAMDLMLNRWLLYQTVVCRFWARAAFYQAGGAYGFRDQLQDCMALMVTRPDLAREHLLRAAARQFLAGDVQHWWHCPAGRGVRTHISDDRLWLPYVVAHYIAVTGDQAVLEESIPFLAGATLAPEQEDAYFEPEVTTEQGSLFEHCARAIDCSLALGEHGLPLMGGGDWNDGMNRVGHAGKGESVWLGWFLHATLTQFSTVAQTRGATAHVQRWTAHAQALQQALERHAWDGAWYRRAYFDDGTPLGTASGAECRIDSLAQSWAVISGAAEPARAQRAMQSVEEYLVRPGDDLVLLFTPPFDKTPLDPGYIKGYLPGVRENGGQYTHAAVWCAIAQAQLGDGDRAAELFAMLNPITHAATRAGVHAYKVEPYVVAADIYAEPPHVRRGGWTWYTGAAGWLYRTGIEWLLGIQKRADRLQIEPCIPRDWPGFTVHYRYGATQYEIVVENPQGVSRGVAVIELDGRSLPSTPPQIALVDDGATHQVRVVLGTPDSSSAFPAEAP
ncbi:MAG: GH36-type glycosyl hydrolase domain-containing protein [Gammaproteobacteria bacterium]